MGIRVGRCHDRGYGIHSQFVHMEAEGPHLSVLNHSQGLQPTKVCDTQEQSPMLLTASLPAQSSFATRVFQMPQCLKRRKEKRQTKNVEAHTFQDF